MTGLNNVLTLDESNSSCDDHQCLFPGSGTILSQMLKTRRNDNQSNHFNASCLILLMSFANEFGNAKKFHKE